MHRLSSLDAQFLAAERGNYGSHYCGLAIYQTGDQQPITAATMRQRLAERMGHCPPLRWKLVTVPFGLDRPVFVDSEVNLDDHGISAGKIFATLLDWPDKKSSAPTGSHADVVPSKATLVARGIAAVPGRRVRALRSAACALAHLDQVPVLRSLPGAHALSQVARGDLRAKRLDAPRTRFNAKLSAARPVAFGTVSLSDVKAIKNELGVTVNDVVIALCAGALRRRLISTGDLPADPLVAYIPVSTRLPDAQDRYGNAISSIIAPIPTHLSDAGERLAFAHETLARAKQRAREAPATLMSDVNDPIPVPLFGIAARGLMELELTAAVTQKGSDSFHN